ncbi:MAG: alpha/beta fold hydrolase [Ardenticatenaceae bacterium]|nr:alpha/beta fold hydrolase [Ardenticatenaceae bacterium]MCB9443264.1 alpha/beta fold hydrolase [Ardenticatenaceae bacterium]
MPTIRMKDVTLYYVEMGQGEPLLLLHGLGSSTEDWPMQMEVFAQQYRVIAVDMRGHGRSTKPPGPYSIPMFAADMVALLQVLQIPSAHILGISLGGMIAFQLAVSYPQMVKSLIIVNSVPAMVVRGFGDRWQLWQRLAIVELMGMRRMGEYLAPRLFPKSEQAEMRQEIIERWAKNDKTAYLAATRSFVGWDVTDHLAGINCPTLVISAEEDYWPLAEKEAYTALIPKVRLLVVEDSRHATPIDQPEVFNTAVLDFLSSVP